MDADGTPKDDVKVPETDVGKEIQAAYEDGKDLMVTIIAAMGELWHPYCVIGIGHHVDASI